MNLADSAMPSHAVHITMWRSIGLGLLALISVEAFGAVRPNVLLFLSDDHSAAHLGCYGNADVHSPNLDKFASQGIRFDRAYVTAPQCVPSRASIMTGRSPVKTDMTRFSAPLPADVITFPELLRKSGYFTGVAGRTHHLDGAKTSEASTDIIDRHHLQTVSGRFDFVKTVRDANGPKFNLGVLEQYREFLDQAPGGKPFFLQLCTSDPHRPFDGNGIPEPRDPAKIKLPPGFPDTEEVRRDLAGYYDEISRMDAVFGKAMEELDKRGLAANTLVIFAGDNGASQLRGKGTLYELGIRVPLVCRWPGVVAPAKASSALISGEDIGPTVLEAAGVPIPKDWTGQSFLPLLRGDKSKEREFVFSERGAHASGLPGITAAFDLGRVVVGRTHKLIYNALWQLPYSPVDFNSGPAWKSVQNAASEGKVPEGLVPLYTGQPRKMFELYDLVNDPYELKNLADDPNFAAEQDRLARALQEWMILERDFLPLPIQGSKKSPGKRK